MDAPPEPAAERTAVRLARAVEARGLAAARWAGRGDQDRGLTVLALATAAAAFVSLFMPWLGFSGHAQSGWDVPLGYVFGLLSLAVVLVELLSVARAWTSRGADLVVFCLVAGAGVIGVSAFANLRVGGIFAAGFSLFEYGAWLGLVLAILLILLAGLRLARLWRLAL
jgi:hypothetical protein